MLREAILSVSFFVIIQYGGLFINENPQNLGVHAEPDSSYARLENVPTVSVWLDLDLDVQALVLDMCVSVFSLDLFQEKELTRFRPDWLSWQYLLE